MQIRSEPGSLKEAVETAKGALRTSPVGSFAMAAMPALVTKLRTLTVEECEFLADLLRSMAPRRADVIAGAIMVTAIADTNTEPTAEPESTGARRG